MGPGIAYILCILGKGDEMLHLSEHNKIQQKAKSLEFN